MSPGKCINEDGPHFYTRTIKGHTDFMCTIRKGQSVNKNYPWKLGRLIKVDRLKCCPLETEQKKTLGYE